MAKKVYVGNLPWNATEDEIRELFEQFGPVQEVALIKDRMTGQSRGFAFVLMADGDATAAMSALNGSDFGGRALRVNEARERQEQEGRGGPGRQRDSDRGQHSSRQHFRGGWEHGARGAHTNRGQGGKRGSCAGCRAPAGGK